MILIAILSIDSCSIKKKYSDEYLKIDSIITPEINIDTPYIDTILVKRNATLNFKEYFLLSHADSIEQLFKDKNFPVFLFHPLFDIESVGYWPSFHTPTSVRTKILDNVSNCISLKLIIECPDPLLDKKPEECYSSSPFLKELPNKDKSFRELARQRMEKLNCKNRINKANMQTI